MPNTELDYVREELRSAERRLADVTDPGRQVIPSPDGQEFRRKLEADISELRERLSDMEAE